VDILDIYRTGWKSWYIVKNGSAVRENMEGRTVSAKPRNIIWDRIGAWNYTLSRSKTEPLVDVTLREDGWDKVRLRLALRFQFDGRVKAWAKHPKLKNKGRFLRKIRIIPRSYCHRNYYLTAWVSAVKVNSIAPNTPVAVAKLTVNLSYGKKGRDGTKIKSQWEISVKGTGQHKARKLN